MSTASKSVYFGPGNAGDAVIFSNAEWRRNLQGIERGLAAQAAAETTKRKSDDLAQKERQKWLDKAILESGDGMYEGDIKTLREMQKEMLQMVQTSEGLSRDPQAWNRAQMKHNDILAHIAISKEQNNKLKDFLRAAHTNQYINRNKAYDQVDRVLQIQDPYERWHEINNLRASKVIDMGKLRLDRFSKANLLPEKKIEVMPNGMVKETITTEHIPEQLDGIAKAIVESPDAQEYYADAWEELKPEEQAEYGDPIEFAYRQERAKLEELKAKKVQEALKRHPHFSVTNSRSDIGDEEKKTINYLKVQAGLMNGSEMVYTQRSREFASPVNGVPLLESDVQKGDKITVGGKESTTIEGFYFDPAGNNGNGQAYMVTTKSRQEARMLGKSPLIPVDEKNAYSTYIQGHYNANKIGRVGSLDGFIQRHGIMDQTSTQMNLRNLDTSTSSERMAQRKRQIQQEAQHRRQFLKELDQAVAGFSGEGAEGKSRAEIRALATKVKKDIEQGMLYIDGEKVDNPKVSVSWDDDSWHKGILGDGTKKNFRVVVEYPSALSTTGTTRKEYSLSQWKEMVNSTDGKNRFILKANLPFQKQGSGMNFRNTAPTNKPTSTSTSTKKSNINWN